MLLQDLDFTLNEYEKLCKAISNSEYQTMTFREFFEKNEKNDKSVKFILIRHDIDENIRYAIDMAKIEFENGIKATYYIRMKKNIFVPEKMKLISSYNHEIGYHYEVIDKSDGDIKLAIKIFSDELKKFREIFDVKTACMHGNPISKYDNKVIWQTCSFSQFDLLGEPYLSLDYNDFLYFSDSGRTWSNKNKVKDILITGFQEEIIRNTNDLIKLIAEKPPNKNICILTHPERWNKSFMDYTIRIFIDYSYIFGKILLKLFRNLKKIKV